MVNEERLRHMIKMAAFDKNDGKACRPMAEYARKDYGSLQLLRSFVSGSLGFLLILLLWVLYSMEYIMQEINKMDIVGFLTSIGIKYLIFMVVYLIVTYVVYNTRYTAGRRKVKKYYSNLKSVNKIYAREDKLKSSSNKDWD